MMASSHKILLCLALIVSLNVEFVWSGSKTKKISPKTLAERAGAAQYSIQIEDELSSDEIGGKSNLKKRLLDDSSFDDSDYEVYQGVVGRAGIDFPVLTGIPQTTFNCRKFGNGYFADLETECQAFHICDEGKKISFLCPNGTIFKQSELICDWWFKVNCASSPGHYAESSEMLSRAQNQHNKHYRHSRPVSSEESSSSSREYNHQQQQSKPKELRTTTTTTTKQSKIRYNKRSRISQELNSAEVFDFDDNSSAPSQTERVSKNVSNRTEQVAASSKTNHLENKPEQSNESLEVEETVSFARNRTNFNGYSYKEPSNKEGRLEATTKRKDKSYKTTTQAKPLFSTTTVAPTTNFNRGHTTYMDTISKGYKERKQTTVAPNKSAFQTTPNSIPAGGDEIKVTTSSPVHTRKSYATARKLDTARTTPFYTPTVPTIVTRRPSVQSDAFEAPQLPISAAAEPATAPAAPSETFEAPQLRISATAEPSAKPALSVSDHALEMIKTLKELNLSPPSPTQPGNETMFGSREGLIIPPSSGPQTLHSLAVYFAEETKLNATNPTLLSAEVTHNSEFASKQNASELANALLSNNTVEKFAQLFGISSVGDLGAYTASTTPPTNYDVEDQFGLDGNNELHTGESQNPAFAAAGSPQIRELARVFTHALSAYLHDPETFRRVLSEIRPTEPTPQHNNDVEEKATTKKEFDMGTGATYLPTRATTVPPTVNKKTGVTDELEVLHFSDVSATSTTEKSITDESTIVYTTESIELSTAASENRLGLRDRTPGSNLIVNNLEKSANTFYDRFAKELEYTTEVNNPIAVEINGGLAVTTTIPYSSKEVNATDDGTDYFPADLPNVDPIAYRKKYGEELQLSDNLPLNEQTTDTPTTTVNPFAALSFDLLPPSSLDSDTFTEDPNSSQLDDDDLQRSQSLSFVSSGNLLLEQQRRGKIFDTIVVLNNTNDAAPTENTSVRGHYITQEYPSTEEPTTTSPTGTTTDASTTISESQLMSTVSYTSYLDPLTINDELMNSGEQLATSTNSPNTYLPTVTTTTGKPDDFTTESAPTRYTLNPSFVSAPNKPAEIVDNLNASQAADHSKVSEDSDISSRHGKNYNTNVSEQNVQDPADASLMQRRANEMFGTLNETQADHLMNVMKKADQNKTVRRLILLLVQTCDDDYNRTVEISRAALLNALIRMDDQNTDEDNDFQIIDARRHSKSIPSYAPNNIANPITVSTTTTEVPATTYRRPAPEVTTDRTTFQYLYESTTAGSAERSSTTTSSPGESAENAETTVAPDVIEETTRFEIRVEDFDSDSTTTEEYFDSTTKAPIVSTTTTTTEAAITTTTARPAVTTKRVLAPVAKRTGRSRKSDTHRVVKDVDTLLAQPSGGTKVNDALRHSDTRALELLQSLYSLASKFGRR